MDVAIDLIQTCACEISQRQKCTDVCKLQKSSGTLGVRLNLSLERGMTSINQFISDHISNKFVMGNEGDKKQFCDFFILSR